jgi:hypothetical protein
MSKAFMESVNVRLFFKCFKSSRINQPQLDPRFFVFIYSASQTNRLIFLQSGEVTALPTVTHNWGWSDWSNFTGF